MTQPLILPTVTASRFDRRLGSGRTKPCIIFAKTVEHEEVELVVKFAAGCEVRGLVCEAFASFLADDLDLPVPQPFLVDIPEEFARTIPNREIAESITRSRGLNFGSRKLSPQFSTWPIARPIPLPLRPVATEVLAFDGLIQNPARSWNNPNCLVRGEELAIFDHDLAFSFLAGVIGAKHPWQPGGLDFLASRPGRHVFFDGLKGTQLNFDRLVGAFESIDQHRLAEYSKAIPEQWRAATDAAEQIVAYIEQLKEHLSEAVAELARLLA
jgi:hypothetical protein